MAENGGGNGIANGNGNGNCGGGDGRRRRKLALNNKYNLRFEPTHEILAFQVLRKRVRRNYVPSYVRCYFRELDCDNFFQRDDFHLRTVDFYFCKRRMPGVAIPVGWTTIEGPTAMENHMNDNVFYGTYATYHKDNTTVIVTEYRFFPQELDNEIALYRILSR
ncbi:hypothetical protein FEM48_Zijuj12G0082400 [Ziziphus jujuba var. spinosa]|uniref:Uncharacterized protein n=1 Tax=Ziziphus jujuba var. spinosa TaxID=714518 RepID=A0A978UC66_ZIZJJ|nr:hypothetical protein FEM48_Zijuj12G0082400 [Ziziphus jujuba var. spinosa]